jgi:hypothetical protein
VFVAYVLRLLIGTVAIRWDACEMVSHLEGETGEASNGRAGLAPACRWVTPGLRRPPR